MISLSRFINCFHFQNQSQERQKGKQAIVTLFLNMSNKYTNLSESFTQPLLHDRSQHFNGVIRSVSRVYIVCPEDLVFPEQYQRWTIDNYPVKEADQRDAYGTDINKIIKTGTNYHQMIEKKDIFYLTIY